AAAGEAGPPAAAPTPDDYRALLTRAAAAAHTSDPSDPAAGARPAPALAGFVELPHLRAAAQQVAGLADRDAQAVRILRLGAGAAVGPRELTRLLWAVAKALEWQSRTPAPDTLGATILHLDQPDPARRGELLDVVAQAAAVGRDLDDPVQLAAFHLGLLGAYADATRLLDAHGNVVGRNWFSGTPLAGPVSMATLYVADGDPAGGTGLRGTATAPWARPGQHVPHLIWAGGGPAHIVMTLPDGTSRAVSYDEVGELVSWDPVLLSRPLAVGVVLAVPRARAVAGTTLEQALAGADPRAAVSARSGRTVWSSPDLAALNKAAALPYAVTVLPVQPGAHQQAVAAWTAVAPLVLPGAEPAGPADGADETGVTFSATTAAPGGTTAQLSTAPPPSHPLGTPLPSIPEESPLPAEKRAAITDDLDRRRPPRLDRDLPAPSLTVDPVRFTDQRKLPVYMGRVGSLLKTLPADVLRRSYSFGNGDPVLRGVDLVVDELGAQLTSPPSVRPGAAQGDGLRETGLLADVRRAMTTAPRTFFGDGRDFSYTNAKGQTRVLKVRTRPYPEWERFAFGYANPTKIDSMARATTTTGRTAVNNTSTALAPTTALGPAKGLANPWGRIFARKTWSKRVQYSMLNQVSSQTETRTTDGSHAHLDDVHYEFSVTDGKGRPIDQAGRPVPAGGTRQRPVAFGFAVRHGLYTRLPDSATRDPELPAEVRKEFPAEMTLTRKANYRFFNTEGFGPVSHIRDWAVQQIRAKSGSSAHTALDGYFSSENFHQMSRVMAAGPTITPPLFADGDLKPLGFFSVRVRSAEAVLIDATTAAELRDILQATTRNERDRGTGSVDMVGASIGPAFQLFGLGKLDLRVLLGFTARYSHSRSRSTQTGGSGAVRSAAQAKGAATGLYLVHKTVEVTAPPDEKAPFPKGDPGTPNKIRKNPPEKWSAPPRTETFHTWAVERMTATEARRLADGDPAAKKSAAPAAAKKADAGPAAPPYLSKDAPTTLGMSRVEEFTFDGGEYVKKTGDKEQTFLERFGDQVLHEVAKVYPDLVAPLEELNPANPRWRGDSHFQMVQSNTAEVLNALAHHSMAGNLEAMMTTGFRIGLVDSRRATRAMRYVWLDADLTDRRYEGTQKEQRLRYSAPGNEVLIGRQGGERGLDVGVETSVSPRDADRDEIRAPLHAGTVAIGGRIGRRKNEESGYGQAATHEAMTIGTKGSNLYSYQISLTAKRGGFRRLRSLLRGVLFLNILGTQPFIFNQKETDLIGPARGNGPAVGRVLLSIPVEHVPAAGPGSARPPAGGLHGIPLPTTARRARDLALSTPAALDQAARRPAAELDRHPYLTLSVVSHPGINKAAEEVLEKASAGSWHLTYQGAPAHDAAQRIFEPRHLTANFDQSSAPTGSRVSGLWSKGAYLSRMATLAHLVKLRHDTLRAITGAVPMETETTVGGMMQVLGRLTRTSRQFFGGQLVYLHSHGEGTGVTGNYAAVISPFASRETRTQTVSRTAVAEINRKDTGRHVLIQGDVDHEIAADSSVVGRSEKIKKIVPRQLAAAAGRRVHVDEGWVGHIPEKSAHRLGLIRDKWGAVPLYTKRSWSPQPWLRHAPFGSYPVNSLNTAAVLADFDRKVHPLGLNEEDRDTIHRAVSSRIVRAVNKEMAGHRSTVPARVGNWGLETMNLWLSDRRARVGVRLVPKTPATPDTAPAADTTAAAPGQGTGGAPPKKDGSGFGGLGHSVELEEHRQATEAVQEGRSRVSGANNGWSVMESAHTADPTAKAAGPSYTEIGSSRKKSTETHTEGSVKIATATTTQAHAEYATDYELILTLEIGEGPERPEGDQLPTGRQRLKPLVKRTWRDWTGTNRRTITATGDVGRLIEHFPLSLMRPDPDPAYATGPDPDPLAPPELPAPGPARPVAPPRTMGPGGWRDVLHPGSGEVKPHQLPADGYKVRGIIGLQELQDASAVAVADAYDTSFPTFDRVDDTVLMRARDTPLTRAGTGSGQVLEDGENNTALTAFYGRTLDAGGYHLPGVSDVGMFGGSEADLRLHAKPDFTGALLLTVADAMKHEAPRRSFTGDGASVGRSGGHESALGGGPMLASEPTGSGVSQAGSGDSSADAEGLTSARDGLSSVNIKPNTAMSFLFAVPTTWLSVAAVRHHLKDSGPGRLVRGTFGHAGKGARAMETDTTVLTWIREDIARDLGLITSANFPAKVAKAWETVTKADKAWTAADKKYWDARRDGEAERLTVLAAAQRRLTTAEQESARLPASPDLPDVAAAQADVDLLVQELADAAPEHEGWAEILGAEYERAVAVRDRAERVAAAAAELARARDARDEAQRHADRFGADLAALLAKAETAADDLHRVRHETDRLTRWYQLAATAEGRATLGATEEPGQVTLGPPAAPAPKRDLPKTGEAPAAPRPMANPEHTAPPWQPVGGQVGRRFDAGADHRLLTATDPDGSSYLYDLTAPADGGNGFYAAVQLARGKQRGGEQLAALVANSSRLPGDVPLDPRAVFHAREVASVLGSAFAQDDEAQAEVARGGGRLPASVTARLTRAQRQALVRLNLRTARRWDVDTARTAAAITAEIFGVGLTVVSENGSSAYFEGPNRDPGRPQAQLTVYERGGQFLAASPRQAVPPPPVAPPEPAPQTPPAPPAPAAVDSPAPPQVPAPQVPAPPADDAVPDPTSAAGVAPDASDPAWTSGTKGKSAAPDLTEGQSSMVEVPRTGECLLYSLMASDPEHVRATLPALAAANPAAHAWLADPGAVRDELRRRAAAGRLTGEAPTGPSAIVVEAMRTFVADQLRDGRLDPQVVGQFRQWATERELATRLARMDRPALLRLLAHHRVGHETLESIGTGQLRARYRDAAGRDAGDLAPRRQFAFLQERGRLLPVAQLGDKGLRKLLTAAYPISDAPLDDEEFGVVLDAVVNWEQSWAKPVGEIFLPLLAYTFDIRIEVVRHDGVRSLTGPEEAPRQVEVHYNGGTHYDGSDAGPVVAPAPPTGPTG
ncbi:hypothetical protein GA0115240_12501, partial [Streptomyces sp. DvalAA-14]|uniref:hypothetical protein n=1 Tax=unclassified Streptomyces TaxID=2593676 RepID=UPI00081B0BF2